MSANAAARIGLLLLNTICTYGCMVICAAGTQHTDHHHQPASETPRGTNTRCVRRETRRVRQACMPAFIYHIWMQTQIYYTTISIYTHTHKLCIFAYAPQKRRPEAHRFSPWPSHLITSPRDRQSFASLLLSPFARQKRTHATMTTTATTNPRDWRQMPANKFRKRMRDGAALTLSKTEWCAKYGALNTTPGTASIQYSSSSSGSSRLNGVFLSHPPPKLGNQTIIPHLDCVAPPYMVALECQHK